MDATNISVPYETARENRVSPGSFPFHPEITPDMELFSNVDFWVARVGACVIAIPGLAANIAAIVYMESNVTGKSIFNKLLMFLFLLDGIYLFPTVLGTLFALSSMRSNALWYVFDKITRTMHRTTIPITSEDRYDPWQVI